MVKYRDGLRGNLTVPDLKQGVIPAFQSFPLTAFHERDEKGNLRAQPDPTAANRGRNFGIENKK